MLRENEMNATKFHRKLRVFSTKGFVFEKFSMNLLSRRAIRRTNRMDRKKTFGKNQFSWKTGFAKKIFIERTGGYFRDKNTVNIKKPI